MKTLFLFILLPVCLFANAQQRHEFYDWQWKRCDASQARFIANIKKTDSGWLRFDYFAGNNQVQMMGLYRDSLCKIRNGYFKHFYADGSLEISGRVIDSRNQGVWLYYHPNRMLRDSITYLDNKPVGISMSWYSNGYPADSTDYDSGVKVSWFDNGQPSQAGHLLHGKLHGKWQFFHKNGQLAALEKYEEGKVLERKLYDEEGKEITDTNNINVEAEFKGGASAWKKYMLKHIYFPGDYKIVNADIVTVVVSAIIDEDGNVTEPYVEIPFKDKFDEIALSIFKKCPKWKPAINHNRRVKQGIRQPVSFQQDN